MNKQIPVGYLGSADVILELARILDPILWDNVGEDEKRIWERLRTSVDAWKDLDQLLTVEFERTRAQEIFDRKLSFWDALAEIREWLHEGFFSAVMAPASWYLGADVFEFYEPPSVDKDMWLDEAIANRALLSGVLIRTEDGTRSGDFLLLLLKDQVDFVFERLGRHDDFGSEIQEPHPDGITGTPAKSIRSRVVGRKPTHDPLDVAKIVFDLMEHHGEFMLGDPEWNSQACLEKAVRKKLKSKLAESSLRAAIVPHLKSWRAQKAGNQLSAFPAKSG